jgi:dTDP-glucose 4,6-dehydratase
MRADVAESRQVRYLFDAAQPDVVYHLAAEFGRHNGRDFPEQTWRTNCLGTRNVIDACAVFDAKLIHASSSEIYGELPTDGEPLYEGLSDERALHPANDYAITKLANEKQCRNAMGRQPIMVLRFFNAYGPGEHYHPYRSVVALFVYRLMFGLPIVVYRDYHRVFMYIGDFIPTLAEACVKFQDGAFINIGGAEYRSVEDLARIVCEHVNPKHELVTYEDKDLHNVQNKRPSIQLAETYFGHAPRITLEQGVPQTVEWMRRTYQGSPR